MVGLGDCRQLGGLFERTRALPTPRSSALDPGPRVYVHPGANWRTCGHNTPAGIGV
jgi:hypothetical protein